MNGATLGTDFKSSCYSFELHIFKSNSSFPAMTYTQYLQKEIIWLWWGEWTMWFSHCGFDRFESNRSHSKEWSKVKGCIKHSPLWESFCHLHTNIKRCWNLQNLWSLIHNTAAINLTSPGIWWASLPFVGSKMLLPTHCVWCILDARMQQNVAV